MSTTPTEPSTERLRDAINGCYGALTQTKIDELLALVAALAAPSPASTEVPSEFEGAGVEELLPEDRTALRAMVDAAYKKAAELRKKRTPSPAEVPAEPVAWMWQHDETGRTGFVDVWQVENGWQAANPRLKLIRPLYASPSVPQAVPQGWLTPEIVAEWAERHNLEMHRPEELRDAFEDAATFHMTLAAAPSAKEDG